MAWGGTERELLAVLPNCGMKSTVLGKGRQSAWCYYMWVITLNVLHWLNQPVR